MNHLQIFSPIVANGFVYDLWRFGAAESAEAKRGAFVGSSSQSCVRFSELGAAYVRIVPPY
jgi:hypothetical protein